eukprot:355550-Chlamydomonas_euryale.AAC.9
MTLSLLSVGFEGGGYCLGRHAGIALQPSRLVECLVPCMHVPSMHLPCIFHAPTWGNLSRIRQQAASQYGTQTRPARQRPHINLHGGHREH